jgi:predicted nuclease of predicted toxin-antitoxin system
MRVSMAVVLWLREHGHDATHLRDQGLHGMTDGEVFRKAAAESRVILTFDLDFGEIAALSKGRKASVILFRLRHARAPHVIDRLAAVLRDSTEALTRGAVAVVEESRYRLRYLPVGDAGEGP